MNIKQVIKKHGFTISQVAESLECSQSALSQSISSNPTTSRLREIANVIGCSMSEFFADEDGENMATAICPHCGKTVKIKLE